MAITGEVMGGDGAVLAEEIRRAERAGAAANDVILVEGVSDQRAIEALAQRQSRDLSRDGVAIIPIAGATNIGRFVAMLGPEGHDVNLVGLCDEAEEPEFRATFTQAGITSGGLHASADGAGIFVCSADLEEELIRALGAEAMVGLIESQGHLRRFRSFQNQPAQRHKTIEAQLWRWMGNHKIRYASLMVEALTMEAVPPPLKGVLASV